MSTKKKTTKTAYASAGKSCEMGETPREKRTDVCSCIPNQPWQASCVQKPTQVSKVLNNQVW